MTFSTLFPDVESCRVRTIYPFAYYIISLEPLTDFIIVVQVYPLTIRSKKEILTGLRDVTESFASFIML